MGKIINSRYNLDFEKSEYYILYNLFTKKSIRFNSEGIENIKNDSIIKIITTEGFDKIIELLNKNRSKVKLESCIDVCDLCREIFSNNKNYELIKVLSEDFIKNEN
ncbi:hypothetical protein H8J88_13920 [Clostridium perfringens]|uniref:hypothetical protein n=1 Tax=Clostridium perfringens TaxID=1502 RepID=UPI0018E3FEC2|nr:hypothetical protein [Clostridium perfringens]MBI6072353.1 hypothetical protein [Clostridium perfringens]MDK0568160.1 hypothetical protein [Clostridium perfringens]MDV5105220.1 hypothetical protein [Clostridium perfringens]